MTTHVPAEVGAFKLGQLLGLSRETVSQLAQRKIIVPGHERGTFALQASVSGYCAHLREQAAGRGGADASAARARLGQAQATLAEARAGRISGELVEVAEVERKWTATCRAIRSRVLAVADRMHDLPARQRVRLAQELRAALSDLSGGSNAEPKPNYRRIEKCKRTA